MNDMETESSTSRILPIFRGSPQYYERVRGMHLGDQPLDFLSINMPPVCNYQCTFCLSGMNERQRPKNSLTQREISSLISDARALGCYHIEVSGEGEPLAYQQVLEHIIQFAGQKEMHTTIFTNGSLLSGDFLNTLARNDTSVAISMDYMDQDRYERFSGRPHSHKAVMQNLILARETFKEHVIEQNGYRVFPLAIHAIAMADNLDEIPRIKEFAAGDMYFSVAPVMNRGTAKDRPELVPRGSRSAEVIEEYSDGSLITSDTSASASGNPLCGTFYYGVGIRHDGEVLFDAHAYDTAGLFGNIRHTPLEELVARLRYARRVYLERFSDGGFCPLRNPGFDRFVQYLRETRKEAAEGG